MVSGKEGTLLLIVEDDAGIAALQRLRLQRAGYEVRIAGTAHEAMEKIKDDQIDLIVLDFMLPDRNGIEFFEQLKAAGHDFPVIVVTALTDQATIIQALRAGVRDFVVKTLDYLDYLPVAVERVLVQVRTERQLAETQSRFSSIIESAKDAIRKDQPLSVPRKTHRRWRVSPNRNCPAGLPSLGPFRFPARISRRWCYKGAH